jgi:3-isopropylmalate/(R)-2-methylmalate dehydratase large subunit
LASQGCARWAAGLQFVGRTLAEKLLARAAGKTDVRPGDIVTCKADLALLLDSGGPRRIWPRLKELGTGVWDPDRIVLVTDHFVPAVDAESAAILKLTREFAREFGIRKFFDMQGIGHVILMEQGLVQPGMFICGGDSHSSNGGAYAAYVIGLGAIEMTGVTVTGEIWVPVPETIRVNWSGRFSRGVVAKDVMLALCRELGMDNAFRAVEYGGDTVAAMSLGERAVLTNMAAELGAETGLVEADETTLAAIRLAGRSPATDALAWRSDPDAQYLSVHDFDASVLSPQVAAPDSPANSMPVNEAARARIDQAYLGSCMGAKLADLRAAAEVLQGRRIASGLRFLVAPASQQIWAEAAADGTLATLGAAGVTFLPTGCGACAALGAGVLAEGEICISSTNRNFKGRMGANSAQVFLASPYTVAASAVAGHIADPREFLS